MRIHFLPHAARGEKIHHQFDLRCQVKLTRRFYYRDEKFAVDGGFWQIAVVNR